MCSELRVSPPPHTSHSQVRCKGVVVSSIRPHGVCVEHVVAWWAVCEVLAAMGLATVGSARGWWVRRARNGLRGPGCCGPPVQCVHDVGV